MNMNVLPSIRYCLLCLLLLSCVAQAEPPTLVLSFKPQVLRVLDAAMLGDVLHIEGALSATDRQALQSLTVPLKGAVLHNAQVMAAIQRQWPDWSLSWKGNTRLPIERGYQQVTGEALAEAARTFLNSAITQHYLAFEIELAEAAENQLLKSSASLSLQASLGKGCQLKSNTCVWVHVVADDGKVLASQVVWFKVAIYDAVLIAKRALSLGKALHKDDFSLEMQDILQIQGTPVAKFSALQGMQLKQPLQSGDVLLQRTLQPVPDVALGQTIMLQVKQGAIALEAQGIAKQQGYIGDWIKVKPISGTQLVKAKIIARGVVEVAH